MKPPCITPYALEKVRDANGKVVTREGRPVYRFYGVGDYDGRGVFLIGGRGNIIAHIPERFESDLASRPTIRSKGWWRKLIGVLAFFVPDRWWDTAAASAGFHDAKCEDPKAMRFEADGTFWIAMHVERTPPVWRDILFRAVTFDKSKESHNDPQIFEDGQPSLPGLGD